jgi:hypothetical protein
VRVCGLSAAPATAPASPKSTYCWCSTSGTPERYIHAVVEMNRFRRAGSPEQVQTINDIIEFVREVMDDERSLAPADTENRSR